MYISSGSCFAMQAGLIVCVLYHLVIKKGRILSLSGVWWCWVLPMMVGKCEIKAIFKLP